MFWALRPQEHVKNKYIAKGKSMVKAIYAINAAIYPEFYGKRYYYTLFFLLFVIPFEYTFYYTLYLHTIITCIAYHEVRLIGVAICCGTVIYIYGIVTLICISKKEDIDRVMEMVGRGFCNYSRPLTDDEQRLLDEPEQNTSRYAKISSIAFFILSLVHFWILPMVKVVQTGTWSTVKNGSIPINDNDVVPVYSFFGSDTMFTYMIKYLHEASAASFEYTITNGYAILYVGLSQQLTGNLKLLSASLSDIHARSVYLYAKSGRDPAKDDIELYDDKYFLKCMNVCINENIRHHITLIKYYHVLQNIVGFTVLALFTGIAIIISTAAYTSFYLLTQEQNADKGVITTGLAVWSLYTIGFFALLTVYCQYGQRVTDESAQLIHSFYDTPWIYCDIPFRRTLSIGMSMSQTDMVLTGMGLVPATRVSIVDIVKTSFSYLNILMAMSTGGSN